MTELFANGGDADQMTYSVVSDLGLHCLPITFLVFPDYNGLKDQQEIGATQGYQIQKKKEKKGKD